VAAFSTAASRTFSFAGFRKPNVSRLIPGETPSSRMCRPACSARGSSTVCTQAIE
jgi:hypothetical protein